MDSKTKEIKRIYRHRRIRKKVVGTNSAPRLYVHRSLNNLYAQVIDDSQQKVLFGMSTLSKELSSTLKNTSFFPTGLTLNMMGGDFLQQRNPIIGVVYGKQRAV